MKSKTKITLLAIILPLSIAQNSQAIKLPWNQTFLAKAESQLLTSIPPNVVNKEAIIKLTTSIIPWFFLSGTLGYYGAYSSSDVGDRITGLVVYDWQAADVLHKLNTGMDVPAIGLAENLNFLFDSAAMRLMEALYTIESDHSKTLTLLTYANMLSIIAKAQKLLISKAIKGKLILMNDTGQNIIMPHVEDTIFLTSYFTAGLTNPDFFETYVDGNAARLIEILNKRAIEIIQAQQLTSNLEWEIRRKIVAALDNLFNTFTSYVTRIDFTETEIINDSFGLIQEILFRFGYITKKEYEMSLAELRKTIFKINQIVMEAETHWRIQISDPIF